MHLVESYALSTGVKIGKPFILQSFFPLPFSGPYISFQPYGGTPAKRYDIWKEVTQILYPALTENGIRVVQFGQNSEVEPKVWGTYDLRGKTSFNQAAYLIKNSLLHLGADSFGIHIASGLGKKIVGLYNVMHPAGCGPYWSDPKDFVVLEPERAFGEKPSYSPEESPKTINLIPPEKIALAVSKLLELDLRFPYESVYVGKSYNKKKIELVPIEALQNDHLTKLGIDSIIVRMDILFNETALFNQLVNGSCSIVTDKEINLDILAQFKTRIKEFVYVIDLSSDPEYVKKVQKIGIQTMLLTSLSEEDLNKIKLKFLDLGGINKEDPSKKEKIEELRKRGTKNLLFRSSCFTVKADTEENENRLFQSKALTKKEDCLTEMTNPPLQEVVDSDDFWEDLEHYIIYEKSS